MPPHIGELRLRLAADSWVRCARWAGGETCCFVVCIAGFSSHLLFFSRRFGPPVYKSVRMETRLLRCSTEYQYTKQPLTERVILPTPGGSNSDAFEAPLPHKTERLEPLPVKLAGLFYHTRGAPRTGRLMFPTFLLLPILFV